MQSVKVPSHKRKGRVVKTHVRRQKSGVAAPTPKPGAGGEMAVKAAAKRTGRLKKGSPEAAAHMAKIRALRKK